MSDSIQRVFCLILLKNLCRDWSSLLDHSSCNCSTYSFLKLHCLIDWRRSSQNWCHSIWSWVQKLKSWWVWCYFVILVWVLHDFSHEWSLTYWQESFLYVFTYQWRLWNQCQSTIILIAVLNHRYLFFSKQHFHFVPSILFVYQEC